MQPHEGTKSAASVNRVRMFIRKELAWLQGFPLSGGSWLHAAEFSPAMPTVLDRERLRTSVQTLMMLRRDFPRALPRLVGDTERWSRTHHALLDLLKPTIHDGAPLPTSPLSRHPFASRALLQMSQRLEREAPPLSAWRTALEWYGWTDLDVLRAALMWLETHAVELTRLRAQLPAEDPLLGVRLWQLSRTHSPRRLAPLIELLTDEAWWRVPLECPESYLPKIGEALKRDIIGNVPLPPVTLPQQLVRWVSWLAEQEAARQRQGLELVATLLSTELLAPWPLWWSKVEGTLRQLRRAEKAERPRVYGKLERLCSRAPAAVPAERLLRVLRGFMTPDIEALHAIAVKALPKVPHSARGCALRLALAHHWLRLWDEVGHEERATLLRYVPAFVDYTKPLWSSAERLLPWQSIWAGRELASTALDEQLLASLQHRQAMNVFFRVLQSAEVASRGEVRLLCALAAHLPQRRVEATFAELRRTALAEDYGHLSRASLQFCHELTIDHPVQFAPLLRALQATEDAENCVRLLRPVAAAYATARLTELLIAALVDGQLQEIVATARKLSFSFTCGEPVPAPGVPQPLARPAWLANYPVPLHDALAALAQYDPAAEQSASKVLAKEFPERHSLERELERLRAVEQPTRGQLGRIANLTTRLTTTRSVSEYRMATLASKLHALVRRRVVEQWRLAVDAKFQEALPPYLGVTAVPKWCTDPEVVTAIAAIPSLSSASQALARRVLSVRTGPAPWDLRDAPANRACLAALRARGLELTPWLDDTAVTEYSTADGQRLHLALERDPLAVLNMGGHFDTCLSPGQCNFFSVFANIADSNKQVLYARTATGAVFGRVLVALTDAGGLLTFHRYSHGRDASFRPVVQDFVHTLARRMNTLVVDSGRVATLVADRWYDDGSVDLTQQIAAFEPGSALRCALPSLPATALVATLNEALAPLPLDELTLPFVLALPELAARSDLIVALLPLIERLPLGLSTLLEVVRLLSSTDASLTVLLEKIFRQACRLGSYGVDEPARLLVEHAPVLALRLLRVTREREVRSWDDESDARRLSIAARAAEKLRRRRQARLLYTRALAQAYDESLRAQCREALERLACS